jgi:hypothetical protein
MPWKITQMPARYAAAPRSISGEPGGGFPGPGQLTDVNVPLLGKHYLLRHVPFVDGQLRGGHLRRRYAWPEGGQDLPLGGEPPFVKAQCASMIFAASACDADTTLPTSGNGMPSRRSMTIRRAA